MSNIHTITSTKQKEEISTKEMILKASKLAKFLIKENDELLVESTKNQLIANEYKSYSQDLEIKHENSLNEIKKLKTKLEDISKVTTESSSEKFFDDDFFKAYSRSLPEERKKQLESEVKSMVIRKY